jgi:hypothetical protein
VHQRSTQKYQRAPRSILISRQVFTNVNAVGISTGTQLHISCGRLLVRIMNDKRRYRQDSVTGAPRTFSRCRHCVKGFRCLPGRDADDSVLYRSLSRVRKDRNKNQLARRRNHRPQIRPTRHLDTVRAYFGGHLRRSPRSPHHRYRSPVVLPVLHSPTNCHPNPIAHRVRRKPQRLPPSLLIENASDRDLLRPKSLPRGVPDQG